MKKTNNKRRKPVKKKQQSTAVASTATMSENKEHTEQKKSEAIKTKGIFDYFSQVRFEAQKITWTTRNETIVSTILVIVMVIIMSLFFFLADQLLQTVIKWILALSF